MLYYYYHRCNCYSVYNGGDFNHSEVRDQQLVACPCPNYEPCERRRHSVINLDVRFGPERRLVF